MKIRTGFVSNSSSSSFICDVSGESFGGYNDQYEVEVCYGSCGHNYCKEYMLEQADIKLSIEKKRELLRAYLIEGEYDQNDDKDYEIACDPDQPETIINELFEKHKEHIYDGAFDAPKECCPICSMTRLSDKDALVFLVKEQFDGDRKKLFEAIKKRFKNYEEFQKYCK